MRVLLALTLLACAVVPPLIDAGAPPDEPRRFEVVLGIRN